MDRAQVWDHVVAERLALYDILRTLSAQEWEHGSLCSQWRVRDVAAHVISSPQLTLAETVKVLPRAALGYNRMILRDGLRRGRASTEHILADYERWAQVRRGPATTTHIEPLLDVLVHTQDILRPLGRRHRMPVEAAALAANRARLLAGLMGSRRLVRSVTMQATDVPWRRGLGPVIEGPIEELLLLSTGRDADRGAIRGAGVDVLDGLLGTSAQNRS